MGRDTKRFFDQAQKNEVFNHADGKCERCTKYLEDGWHAHHRARWSDGGRTIVSNGMAVCVNCHKILEREYTSMLVSENDKIKLRKPQEEMETAFYKMISEHQDGDMPPVMVAILACGSGKTLGAENCCNVAFRDDFADGAIYLTPRIALCKQYERAWDYTGATAEKANYTDFSQFFDVPKMGIVRARKNKSPVLFEDLSGYSVTYSALVSDLKKVTNKQVHYRNTGIVGRRFILVLDEAQALGYTPDDDDFFRDRGETKAYTEAVEKLYEHPNCMAVILMTATDIRSDSMPLFLGKYSEPDEAGKRILIPDVRFTYVDGVSLGYLRPFDFHLEGAELDITKLFVENGEEKFSTYDSRKTSKKLEKFMRVPAVWQLLVDRVIERLLYVRENIWDGYRALASAIDITHAGKISAYIEQKYPQIRTLTVVGDLSKIDEDKAGKSSNNLDDFEKGNYDLLLNVRMAFVGFDHPRIAIVGVLTHWRHFSFLEQLCGRGGRIYAGRPVEEQVLWVIGLDDPKMREFVKYMREATLGYIKPPIEGPPPPPGPESFEIVDGVRLTGSAGEGFFADGVLDAGVHAPFDQLLQENKIATPSNFMAAIIRKSGGTIKAL